MAGRPRPFATIGRVLHQPRNRSRPWPTTPSRPYDLVILGAGTGGYSAAFRAGQLGLKVALVDALQDRRHLPPHRLHPDEGDARVGRPVRPHQACRRVRVSGWGARPSTPVAIAARRDQVVERLHKGLLSLVRKNSVEYIRGRGRLEGPTRVRVQRIDADDQPHRRGRAGGPRRHPRHRLAREVAAGPRAGRRAHPDQRRHPALATRCRRASSSWVPARWASSSPATTPTWAPRSRCSSTCRRSCRSRMPRSARRWSARSASAASGSSPARASTRAAVAAGRRGRPLIVGKEGEEPDRAARRADARGDRPGREHRRRRPRDDEGRRRARPRQGRRRRCGRPTRTSTPSATSSAGCGSRTSPRTRASPRSTPSPGEEVEPVDYLKMPRATYSRPQVASIGRTQQECERDGIPFRVGKFPFQASGKAIINGDTCGFVKVIAHAETRRGPRRPHDRRARHGADRRGQRGDALRGAPPGSSARRSIRTRPSPRRSARPRSAWTASPSTSDAGGEGARPLARSRPLGGAGLTAPRDARGVGLAMTDRPRRMHGTRLIGCQPTNIGQERARSRSAGGPRCASWSTARRPGVAPRGPWRIDLSRMRGQRWVPRDAASRSACPVRRMGRPPATGSRERPASAGSSGCR